MKFSQRTYGATIAIMYIYRFNLDEESITPRLYCDGQEKHKLSSFVESVASNLEPVIAINGGLFNLITLTDHKPHGDTYISNVRKNDLSTMNTGDLIMDLLYNPSAGLLVQETYSEDLSDTSVNWLRSGAYNLIKDYDTDVYDSSDNGNHYHSSLFTERGAKNAIGLIGNSKKETNY